MQRVLIVVLVSLGISAHAQTLTTKFSNIRNNKGVFRVGFFTDEESYKSGDPKFYLSVSKDSISGGEMTLSFDSIPTGTYGIVVLDDENSNDKTDYYFYVLPKEGFGLSNYRITEVRIPKFEDFRFEFLSDQVVHIKMKYL